VTPVPASLRTPASASAPVSGARGVCDRVLLASMLGLAPAALLSISVTQILLGLATAALVVRVALDRGLGAYRTGVERPLLALVVWAVAMVPLSGDPAQSAVYLRRFWLLTALFAAAGLVRGRHGALMRRGTLAGLLAGGAGAAVYGLVRYARAGGAFVDAWDGFLKNRADLLQGYMTAGGLMMITCLVALAFLLTVRRRGVRLLLALAAVPMAAALLLTLTRSAWLGCGVGALVMLLTARRRAAAAVLAAAALLLVLVPGPVHDRTVATLDPARLRDAPRLAMWGVGLEMIRDHPVTGVGDHDLNELYWQYRERDAGGPVGREAYPGGPILVIGHLHDNALQIAAIWGLPGLILAVVFMVALLRRLLRRWHGLRTAPADDGDPAPAAGWALAAVGVWWAFVVAGMFEWNFGDAEVAQLLWLVCGLALGADRPAAPRAAAGLPSQSA